MEIDSLEYTRHYIERRENQKMLVCKKGNIAKEKKEKMKTQHFSTELSIMLLNG